MRPCDGGYMADRWSVGLGAWIAAARARIEAPTPEAVLDTDIFLDVRPLAGALDVTSAGQVLLAGADSPRLLHGLAVAANSFSPPLTTFGRLPHGPLDLKRGGLAPIVLLARLYGLRARSTAVGTRERLAVAREAGELSAELIERLDDAFELLMHLRLANQLSQSEHGLPFSDAVAVEELTDDDQQGLRTAFRAVRSAQSVTSLTFRTDL